MLIRASSGHTLAQAHVRWPSWSVPLTLHKSATGETHTCRRQLLNIQQRLHQRRAGRQHLSGFQSVIIHAQRLSLCIQMYTNRHTLGLLLKSRGKKRVRSNPLVSAVHPSSGLLFAFWKEFYGNVRWLYSTHWTSSLKIAQGHFLKFWQLQNRHPQETVKQGQKSARTGRCWGHDHPEGITNANFSFSYGGRTFLSV